MNTRLAHEPYRALELLSILQEMAAKKTNAVLELLGNIDHLESEHSYPETGLLFAADKWRAFYHCHEATSMHPKEHGHFHIFTATGNQAWAHVAGLSIDAEWLERERLLSQLETAVTDVGEEGLVGRWLVALLQLYHYTLTGLLIKRDEQIQLKLKGRSMIEALDDRDIYTLATQAIDLQSMLEKHLLQNACPDAEPDMQQGT
jgi:hypothetical protein